MPEGSSLQFIPMLICLIFSAYFSLAEASFANLSKVRPSDMADAGVKGAEKIEKIIHNNNKLQFSVLIGSNIANISAGAFAARFLIDITGDIALSITVGTCATVLIILIFADALPKSYAAKNAARISVFMVTSIRFFMFIFTPVIWILQIITSFAVKTFGWDKAKGHPLITEDELKTLVDVSSEEGVIEESEKLMINNVFEFGDNEAKDVMTPRTEIVSLPIDAKYSTVLELFRKEYYSRVPVYRDDMDHIVGILHFKDFIFSDMTPDNFDLDKLLRPPLFSYESKPTSKLFAEMREDNIAMAIILDEYGGTLGLVSVHDLIEEIVGNVSDEYDEEDIIKISDNEYLADGGAKIDDFNDLSGTQLESEEYDSLGGFIIELLDAIPENGANISFEDKEDKKTINFTVEEMDKNRIAKIRILITPLGYDSEEISEIQEK